MRRVTLEMGFDARPGCHKFTVPGARRQFDIELGADRLAATGFVGAAAAGKQAATVLVNVGDDHAGIGFKAVEHAVAVVGVDVYVGHARDTVHAPQRLNHHPDIVVDTKTCGVVASSMMETTNRLQTALMLTTQQPFHARQRAADHARGNMVQLRKNRRVTRVERGIAAPFSLHDAVDVGGCMKAQQFVARRASPALALTAREQTLALGFAQER